MPDVMFVCVCVCVCVWCVCDLHEIALSLVSTTRVDGPS